MDETTHEYTGTSWSLQFSDPPQQGAAKFDVILYNAESNESFTIKGTTLMFHDDESQSYRPYWLPSPLTGELKMRLVNGDLCNS